jgi:transmembrane sensor
MAHDEDAAPKRRWLLAAAIAMVVFGAGGWGANRFWLNPSYTTQIGEQRIVRLMDGSRVTLNSDSRVVVSYRQAERRLSIDRGEAFFEVANEAARPFRVRAGDRVVEALGTSFVVRREAQQLTVTLVEGRVAIRPLAGSLKTDAPVTLNPGQRLRVAVSDIKVSDPIVPHIDAPPIDAVTAWRRGELMLDKTALSDAVAEMNRYDRRQLIIDDAQSAAIQVSGIYHTGDSAVFARMVAGMYGLELSARDGNIHLSSGSASGAVE